MIFHRPKNCSDDLNQLESILNRVVHSILAAQKIRKGLKDKPFDGKLDGNLYVNH